MDSMIPALALMGVIGAITIFGGYRLTNRGGKRRSSALRAVGTAIMMIVLGAFVLFDEGVFDDLLDGQGVQVEATSAVPYNRLFSLALNESTPYQLTVGDAVGLAYNGELGQIVSFTVKPEVGSAPSVSLVTGNPPNVDIIVDGGAVDTLVCGYQFDFNGEVIFVFEAQSTTTYTVELVDGNEACQE